MKEYSNRGNQAESHASAKAMARVALSKGRGGKVLAGHKMRGANFGELRVLRDLHKDVVF